MRKFFLISTDDFFLFQQNWLYRLCSPKIFILSATKSTSRSWTKWERLTQSLGILYFCKKKIKILAMVAPHFHSNFHSDVAQWGRVSFCWRFDYFTRQKFLFLSYLDNNKTICTFRTTINYEENRLEKVEKKSSPGIFTVNKKHFY